MPSEVAKFPDIRCASHDQLRALRNNVFAAVTPHEVDMIGRHHVVGHAKPKSFPGLEQPVQITRPIVSELVQEVLMAAVGDRPDQAGQEMAVGARHRFFFRACNLAAEIGR